VTDTHAKTCYSVSSRQATTHPTTADDVTSSASNASGFVGAIRLVVIRQRDRTTVAAENSARVPNVGHDHTNVIGRGAVNKRRNRGGPAL
jgi:hypothetical protein